MRIAVWNVNGLRARLEFVLHWLRSRRPDVVGLQELKLTDEQFPHNEFRAVGYEAVTHGQKGWNGVAILSREAARLTQTGLPGEEEFGARLISAEVGGLCFTTVYVPNGKSVEHAEVGGLCFTTVYVPNGKSVEHADYARKLAWYDALAGHLRARHNPARPLVLCGDFNVCPAPLDSWNEAEFAGRIFHTDSERERFRALLDWGLSDIFREKFPDLQAFSWWDYRGGAFHRKQGLRIDFLLASPQVMSRVRSVEIDREYRKKKDGLTPSDHCPLVADLD